MIPLEQAELALRTGKMDKDICEIYSCTSGSEQLSVYKSRFLHVIEGYRAVFGRNDEIALFSAPGDVPNSLWAAMAPAISTARSSPPVSIWTLLLVRRPMTVSSSAFDQKDIHWMRSIL